MLARAERRSRQALKLVEKWKVKLADLDREGVAAKQRAIRKAYMNCVAVKSIHGDDSEFFLVLYREPSLCE
jgi:hypothetical protein